MPRDTPYLHQLVARLLANSIDRQEDGEPEADILADALKADVVFGVWRDPHQPLGIAFIVIKGEALLDDIRENKPIPFEVGAHPFANWLDVLAVRERLSKLPNGHD